MQYFNVILKVKGQPTSWYNMFADVYGIPTSSYDGYIKTIVMRDHETVELDCYLVEDKVKNTFWRELYPTTWKDQQKTAIHNAIVHHSNVSNYTINKIVIQES